MSEVEEAFAVIRAIRSMVDHSLFATRTAIVARLMDILDGTDIGAIGGRREPTKASPMPSETPHADPCPCCHSAGLLNEACVIYEKALDAIAAKAAGARAKVLGDAPKAADSSCDDPLAPMTAEKRAQCEASDREHPAEFFVSDELAALRVLAEAVGTLVQANDEASVWGKTRPDIAWRSVRAAFKAAEPFTRKETP